MPTPAPATEKHCDILGRSTDDGSGETKPTSELSTSTARFTSPFVAAKAKVACSWLYNNVPSVLQDITVQPVASKGTMSYYQRQHETVLGRFVPSEIP